MASRKEDPRSVSQPPVPPKAGTPWRCRGGQARRSIRRGVTEANEHPPAPHAASLSERLRRACPPLRRQPLELATHILRTAHRRLDLPVTVRALRYLHNPAVGRGQRVVLQLCATGAAHHVYAHSTLIAGIASHSELTSVVRGVVLQRVSGAKYGPTLTHSGFGVTSLLYSPP